MEGPARTPVSARGHGDGRQLDSHAFLKINKITLLIGMGLLALLLAASPPTVPTQCGYILLTATFCWHSSNLSARIVTTTSSAVLAISAALFDAPWEEYLLVPMAIVAGEGMLRLRMHFNEAEKAANTDRLTGALTRRGFAKMLGRELRLAGRHNRTTALIFLDLDYFKQVNDRYGHAEGDRVLIRVVSALREVLLKDDHIARIGGDEFLVFLRFADDRGRLDEFQSLLTKAIERLPWQISASAGGIIIPPKEYLEADALIQLADNLMYDVKRSGRGRIDMQHLSEQAGSLYPSETLRTGFVELVPAVQEFIKTGSA